MPRLSKPASKLQNTTGQRTAIQCRLSKALTTLSSLPHIRSTYRCKYKISQFLDSLLWYNSIDEHQSATGVAS